MTLQLVLLMVLCNACLQDRLQWQAHVHRPQLLQDSDCEWVKGETLSQRES